MTKLREINITINNSKMFSQKESFNKRWNIIDTKEHREQLKNRCLLTLENELNKANFNDSYTILAKRTYINTFCMNISISLGIYGKTTYSSKFTDTDLYKYINCLNMNNLTDYNTLLFFLELCLNYNFEGKISNSNLAKKIAEIFKVSNTKVRIIKDESYKIYPTDIELFDEKLIVDVLNWLDNYPKTKEHFSNALRMQRIDNRLRIIVDELRLSLEFMFKQLFDNDKSLENQKSNLGKYFKDNCISSEISNMYTKLFILYTDYNNHNAKHNDMIKEIEIDYLIYLTGTFIRFILLIEQNKISI
ncbi:MAG: hypothetical protein HFJ12_04870 [Bacilli bacterium]|nr:hypothetical protein [Bacilli bacterium]